MDESNLKSLILLNFPLPYPNELIYSTIARAGIHHAITSPKNLLDDIFGNRKIIATIDIPNHLSSILRHLPESYSLERLIYEHTLFPLYSTFTTEETRQRCITWMHNKSKGSIHLALGIAASRVKSLRNLRYCPMCLIDQYQQYGECYWSRLWQVQGANSCLVHQIQLSIFNLDLSSINRHEFIAANINIQSTRAQPAHPLDIIITKRISELFLLKPSSSPTLHQWSTFYKKLAQQSGFQKGNKHIDHQKISEKILQFWDRSWLEFHNLDQLHRETSWLRNIFRKHRKSFSYLEHIIVLEALLPQGWQWGKILSKIKDTPLKANFEITNTNHKLFADKTLLKEKHQQWLELIEVHGIKTSRQINGALYAWLYRNDKAHLMRVNTRFHQKTSSSSIKIDWSARDIQTVKLLFHVLYQIIDDNAAPRQSRNWFLKQLPLSATIEKNLSRLPLTLEFLNHYCEDISCYQIRRITFTVIKYKLLEQPIVRWKLLRYSGLSNERLTQTTLNFLKNIKRVNYA